MREQLDPGIIYITAINPAIMVARRPINIPFLTRNGRGISGLVFLSTRKDKATRPYATQQAKLAASTIQTNITRPKKGAITEIVPKNKIAT